MRILVVEDEPALAEQLASALGQAGYAVDCATDGRQADERALTEAYDAVLLDLGLPGTDGLALLRRWRTNGLNREPRAYSASHVPSPRAFARRNTSGATAMSSSASPRLIAIVFSRSSSRPGLRPATISPRSA